MKKLFIVTLLLSTVLWPSVSMAQLDQRCWREADCIDVKTKGAFIQNDESRSACGGEIDAVENQNFLNISMSMVFE